MLRPLRRPLSALSGCLLAAGLFVGLAGEVLRPGHHVHLDGEGHHHHPFLGPHEHPPDAVAASLSPALQVFEEQFLEKHTPDQHESRQHESASELAGGHGHPHPPGHVHSHGVPEEVGSAEKAARADNPEQGDSGNNGGHSHRPRPAGAASRESAAEQKASPEPEGSPREPRPDTPEPASELALIDGFHWAGPESPVVLIAFQRRASTPPPTALERSQDPPLLDRPPRGPPVSRLV